VKDKWSRTFIGLFVIVAMLITGIGFAMAEPNHVLSGRDRIGTYGKDGKSARTGFLNSITMEGSTSDAFETVLSPVDPTADNVILFPNSSGTVQLTSGAFAGALADGKIYIGNSAGTAVQVTPSGDWTITNAGVSSLAANSVGTNEAYVNTVTVTIPATSTQGTATVTSGSTLMGAPYGVANIQFLALNGITNASIAGTTLTLITNGTTGANAVVYKAVVLEP
jgi:hypothetical protein